MKGLLIILAALFSGGLAGCMSVPYDQSKMTAEQLKAIKESSAVASCAKSAGPWGGIFGVTLQIDATKFAEGSVTVNTDCAITVSTKPVFAPIPVQLVQPVSPSEAANARLEQDRAAMPRKRSKPDEDQ